MQLSYHSVVTTAECEISFSFLLTTIQMVGLQLFPPVFVMEFDVTVQ